MDFKMIKKLVLSLILTVVSGCANYELVDWRIVPVFDSPSYQTDVHTYILWSDEDSVYTVEGSCYIKATKALRPIGTSLWLCTQGISTGEMFTEQELLESESYHVVVNYTTKPLVIEQEIGPCNMDVGLFDANNCTPFGSMNPIEYAGLVLITGNYVEIFASRPVDGSDWSRLNTLGHELCHAACEHLIGKEEPVPYLSKHRLKLQ